MSELRDERRATEESGGTGEDTANVVHLKSFEGATSDELRAGSGSRKYRPLLELIDVRIKEFLREKEAVFWVFVFPVLLAFALGIAFRNTGPEVARVAVVSEGATSTSTAREIASTLSMSPDVEAVAMSEEDATRSLRSGRVALLVVAREGVTSEMPRAATSVPDSASGETSATNEATPATNEANPATSEGTLASRRASFSYRFDPTRPESRVAQLAVDRTLGRALGQKDVVAAREEHVSEPGGRYIDFLIPGLIGLNLMGSGMWAIGFNIVTARGRKLLKLFAATPMRRSDYLLSYMLSRLIFLLLEVAAVLGFGWLVFGVAVRGSLWSVALVAVLGGLTFSGLGLLVAARPKTIEGVSGLMNFVMLPMWLLSGTFFSYERFPEFLHPFIKALPLTAVNDALRALINEGATLASLWVALTVLVVWAALSFAGALKLFRWQ